MTEAILASQLGDIYHEGVVIPKNLTNAISYYTIAAERDWDYARSRLGDIYCWEIKDYAQAEKWYRKAAEQGNAHAQFALGQMYDVGNGVPKDSAEAIKWYRKAAEQNNALSQFALGQIYYKSFGVPKDTVEALKWFRKAAEQGDASAQCLLGWIYEMGDGVSKDSVEAFKWYRKAAEQGDTEAQNNLGGMYCEGVGVRQDYAEAYKWYNVAAAQGANHAARNRDRLAIDMTPEQIAEAQRLARNFKPILAPKSGSSFSGKDVAESRPSASGTGFFISEDGFLVTNEHVVKDAAQVRLVTSAGLISAKVVKVDAANDLALLKAEGKFSPLPVASSRSVKLGATVATVGFPNIGLQGFAPKLAKGEIASLSGAGDDARYFQISVPVQPGNSGGALVDERGNVVGVVSAKLNARVMLATVGTLPENVNYAVKSSFLLGFLESVPEVAAKLKEPRTKAQNFEDVVKSAEQAAVLVLVY